MLGEVKVVPLIDQLPEPHAVVGNRLLTKGCADHQRDSREIPFRQRLVWALLDYFTIDSRSVEIAIGPTQLYSLCHTDSLIAVLVLNHLLRFQYLLHGDTLHALQRCLVRQVDITVYCFQECVPDLLSGRRRTTSLEQRRSAG